MHVSVLVGTIPRGRMLVRDGFVDNDLDNRAGSFSYFSRFALVLLEHGLEREKKEVLPFLY